MNTQPEALRLADNLDYLVEIGDYAGTATDAATELRRLHALNAELLEALKMFMAKHRHTYGLSGAWDEEMTKAESAITKAEGCAA